MRAIHCLLDIVAVGGIRTFIESHDNVRTQVFLDLDGTFGGQAFHGTVNMRFESHPIFVNFSHICKGENLKAARVGQHRFVPLHELVQPTHFCDKLIPRAQEKVVGVREDKRSIQLFQLGRCDRFDSCLGANRCKNRRLDDTMRCAEFASAGIAIFRDDFIVEAFVRIVGA